MARDSPYASSLNASGPYCCLCTVVFVPIGKVWENCNFCTALVDDSLRSCSALEDRGSEKRRRGSPLVVLRHRECIMKGRMYHEHGGVYFSFVFYRACFQRFDTGFPVRTERLLTIWSSTRAVEVRENLNEWRATVLRRPSLPSRFRRLCLLKAAQLHPPDRFNNTDTRACHFDRVASQKTWLVTARCSF